MFWNCSSSWWSCYVRDVIHCSRFFQKLAFSWTVQMFAIMTNWKTEFHKPLTRPGVKHKRGDEHLLFDPSSSHWVHKFQLARKWPENEWISCYCGKLWWECVDFVELIWTKRTLVNERNNCLKHDNHWHSLRIDDAKPKNLFGQPGQQTSVGRRMYWFQLKY